MSRIRFGAYKGSPIVELGSTEDKRERFSFGSRKAKILLETIAVEGIDHVTKVLQTLVEKAEERREGIKVKDTEVIEGFPTIEELKDVA